MDFIAADFTMSGTYPHYQEEEFFLLRKKRVLLVEEDWDFSQLLCSLLRKHLDIDVEVVKNSYQALSRMTHEAYDVLIMDCAGNPVQDLLEAEQFLEPLFETDLEDVGKIPVVVLTQNREFSLEGWESHYFRISAAVVKDAHHIDMTVQKVENELNEILEL